MPRPRSGFHLSLIEAPIRLPVTKPQKRYQLRTSVAHDDVGKGVRRGPKLCILDQLILVDHASKHFAGLQNVHLTVNVARLVECDGCVAYIAVRSPVVLFEQESRICRIVGGREHSVRDANANARECPNDEKMPAPSNEPKDSIDVHSVSII